MKYYTIINIITRHRSRGVVSFLKDTIKTLLMKEKKKITIDKKSIYVFVIKSATRLRFVQYYIMVDVNKIILMGDGI